tara:strand:- start:197 stop:1996 length:1800 start_codon:yes stop_codon:yes gene_type:complete
MAFFTPSLSPAVVTREIDLTGIVPNVATSTGAYVGDFRWGPVRKPTFIDNESTLVAKFAAPDKNNSVSFHSAAYFSKYSSELLVIREVDSNAVNAFDDGGANAADSFFASRSATLVRNDDHFDTIKAGTLATQNHGFMAKYAGALGNSLQIQLCPKTATDSAFDNWPLNIRNEFTSAPGTSSFATSIGASDDEVHVAVLDADGEFTGTKGTILETFPFLSLASNAKNPDGSTNYIADVINNQSNYVMLVDAQNIDSDYDAAGAGDAAIDAKNYALTDSAANIKTVNLALGVDTSTLDEGDVATGFDTIEDVDAYTVDFLISPPVATSGTQAQDDSAAKTIINDLINIAAVTRKDCVVVASPPKQDLTATDPVTETVEFANSITQSNYCFLDNNWIKVFDKYNDEYIYIPANSSTAGLMAQTDQTNAPWFSPAGLTRGLYFGVTDILHSPNKAERDRLYRASVNPITNLPGNGITLFGDKTMQDRPSAFDRINVRRLFLALERAISEAAKSVLFEFNDEFTRAQFVNIVEPFLREVKGRRGITDFRVVCDETNNTPEIIDRNEFIATIFIKPARAINYVTLNFVATRTGVDFEEVVGLSF